MWHIHIRVHVQRVWEREQRHGHEHLAGQDTGHARQGEALRCQTVAQEILEVRFFLSKLKIFSSRVMYLRGVNATIS